jgi:hypothetical protein
MVQPETNQRLAAAIKKEMHAFVVRKLIAFEPQTLWDTVNPTVGDPSRLPRSFAAQRHKIKAGMIAMGISLSRMISQGSLIAVAWAWLFFFTISSPSSTPQIAHIVSVVSLGRAI